MNTIYKIDEVLSAMMAAMKAKDKERKDALSALLTALKKQRIDKRRDSDLRRGNTGHLKRDHQLKECPRDDDLQTARIFSQQNATAVSQSSKNTPEMMDEEEIKAVVSALAALGLDAPM